MEKKVATEERGWAGHFIASSACNFRRNTLLTCGDERVVVSTVGNMQVSDRLEIPEGMEPRDFADLGGGRFYETMAFRAHHDGTYWDADIGYQLNFSSPWALPELTRESDAAANAMHDAVVEELRGKLSRGEKIDANA